MHRTFVPSIFDTHLLMDQLLPDLCIVPRERRNLAWVREKAIAVDIDPVQDARLFVVVFMDCVKDAALLHLALSPVREARLWVANIASAARFMIAQRRDRRQRRFELLLVDLCASHKKGTGPRERSAHHLRGRPMARAQREKRVGEMGGGHDLCLPWDPSSSSLSTAPVAYA